MNDEQYSLTQQHLLLLIPFVRDLQLKEFISRIQDCETITPMLDPTLYMKGADKLEQIKHLAQALLPFQEEVEKQQRALHKS